MNRDEVLAKWDSMTPRERDAWVAEDVMGWTNNHGWWTCAELNVRYYDDTIELVENDEVWNPSQNIKHAWEVVEKMQRDHVHISIHWMDGTYTAEMIETDPEEGYKYLGQYLDAKTAPEAICKCALLSLISDGDDAA